MPNKIQIDANLWPQAVKDLSGAWPVFPESAEIRNVSGVNAPREPLESDPWPATK